jgi:hypothetical protein
MSDTLNKLVKEAWRQACENGRSEAVRLMRRDVDHVPPQVKH